MLDELDALMLEALLHQRHRKDQDLRVKKKGMREGERWSGDEELYFKRALKSMLAELRKHVIELEKKDPEYWDRYPELEIPSAEPRESNFTAGEPIKPKQVICLDTKEIYPSCNDAAQQLNVSVGNLASVCRGERSTVNGLHYAYLEDYKNGHVPKHIPGRGTRRYVRCIDTGEIFSSLEEAAEAKNVNSSKITAVCKGKRKSTGGLRWEYVDNLE